MRCDCRTQCRGPERGRCHVGDERAMTGAGERPCVVRGRQGSGAVRSRTTCHHVGGTGPVVAQMGRNSSVWPCECVGENGKAGTVRTLDRLTRLFSALCDGGEGGIRSVRTRSCQRFRRDSKCQNRPNPLETRVSGTKQVQRNWHQAVLSSDALTLPARPRQRTGLPRIGSLPHSHRPRGDRRRVRRPRRG